MVDYEKKKIVKLFSDQSEKMFYLHGEVWSNIFTTYCVLELTLAYVRQPVYSPSMLEYFHNVLTTVPQYRVRVATQCCKKETLLNLS